jgi:hypothetical protein
MQTITTVSPEILARSKVGPQTHFPTCSRLSGGTRAEVQIRIPTGIPTAVARRHPCRPSRSSHEVFNRNVSSRPFHFFPDVSATLPRVDRTHLGPAFTIVRVPFAIVRDNSQSFTNVRDNSRYFSPPGVCLAPDKPSSFFPFCTVIQVERRSSGACLFVSLVTFCSYNEPGFESLLS